MAQRIGMIVLREIGMSASPFRRNLLLAREQIISLYPSESLV